MTTFEDAAEELMVKLRGLDSEIDESEHTLEELRGRVADLELVVQGLLDELAGAAEDAPVGAGLEASHRASIERMREKGRAAARRRFLGGE